MYDETEKMLSNGIIQPSTSAWAANVLMVPKPSDPLGGLRYVVDYRYLNKFTIADSSVIPRVDDLLDSLAGADVLLDDGLRSWVLGRRDQARASAPHCLQHLDAWAM